MSKEIVEAIHALAGEKGIPADRLMGALEDALLSAYKKTPGSAKYARVEVDPASGDFRVFELILPPDLEEELLDEVEEEIGEAEVDPETGELVGASDDEVTVAAGDGVVSIPYSVINRGNLLEDA